MFDPGKAGRNEIQPELPGRPGIWETAMFDGFRSITGRHVFSIGRAA